MRSERRWTRTASILAIRVAPKPVPLQKAIRISDHLAIVVEPTPLRAGRGDHVTEVRSKLRPDVDARVS